jgi:hypothetical protein
MYRLPNIPPLTPGDPMSRRPSGMSAIPNTGTAGTAVAAPPRREAQPAQHPLNLTDKKEDSRVESNDELIAEFLKEHHTLPKIVLPVCTILAIVIAAVWGFRTGGPSTATFYGIMGLLAVVVSCASATAAGWIVSKIFNEDFGTFGEMALRFSAVAAAQFPVLAGLVMIAGFFPAMLFNVPIMIGVTIVVAGVDLFRSIVFSIIVGVVNFMLASFAVMSLSASAPV